MLKTISFFISKVNDNLYDKKVTKINGVTDKRMNEASEGQTVIEVIRILDYTGCSLNIVFFFEHFKIYSGLWSLSVCTLDFMLGPLNSR